MRHLPIPIISLALGVILLASSFAQPASAEATLVVEADSGRVLHAEHATYPWYPASTTKLMTMYLTLKAVKAGRLTMDSLVTVSPNAVAQAPSKMGFKAGTQLTVDNALKMLMVKSANDMAVVLAEGVSGSIEKFADDMNAASRRLGMTQSSWVNPNGLPADEQITSARDMAILARAILRELPEYEMYWHIPSIRFGRRIMRNTNGLIGRYPEADGMKTGFICASGFNVVATATRGGRKLIVVVFGSRSGMVRSEKAAQLFEKGFSAGGLGWLMPSFGTVENLQPIAAAPPNLRDEMCGKHRRRPASEEEDGEAVQAMSSDVDPSSAYAGTLQSLRGRATAGPLLGPLQASVPIPVWVGLRPTSAQPTEMAEGRARKKRGTAIARTPEAKDTPKATAAAPAAEPKAAAKPATANASAGGFSLTPSIRSPKVGTFAPASAEEKPTAAPASGDKSAAKPKTAAKPDQAAKPKPKAATAAKPDAASTKQ
ncbi:MAG: D-alanyl-D-alanine carboxypeptidase family protein [Alphaproteobacteria bacterium]